MESPLLNGSEGHEGGESADYPEVRGVCAVWRLFLKESVRLWSIGGPIVFQLLCLYGINSSTQIFVGHISELDLAAVAISLSAVSTFAFGFMYGMGSALETLCGQAYGAGEVEMLGVYLQRSWIILFVCAVLMTPIYLCSELILKAIGEDDDIAELAGKFCMMICPQAYAFAFNFPIQKFLQAQRKDKPTLFRRFFQWLKPGGKVLISDYCKSPKEPSPGFEEYIKQRGYDLHDVQAYGQMLKDAGFVDVLAEDRTDQFTSVLQKELDAVEKDKDNFIHDFSQEDYDEIVEGWKRKLKRSSSGEQRWGLFIAKKGMNDKL